MTTNPTAQLADTYAEPEAPTWAPFFQESYGKIDLMAAMRTRVYDSPAVEPVRLNRDDFTDFLAPFDDPATHLLTCNAIYIETYNPFADGLVEVVHSDRRYPIGDDRRVNEA